MRIISLRSIAVLLLLALIGCAAGLSDPFATLPPATSSDYGYTAENPIRIKYSKDAGQNIDFCKQYMANLRTRSSEGFRIVDRVAVPDPKNKPSRGGFLGIPKRGAIPRGGILDAYKLISDSGTDTLRLYFDIYHKEPISIPSGLVFVGYVDSLTNIND